MIAIEADLAIATATGTVKVEHEEDGLVILVPDARTGIELLGTLNTPLGGRRTVQALHGLLRDLGVALHVRVRSADVARIGAGADPGLVARLATSALLR